VWCERVRQVWELLQERVDVYADAFTYNLAIEVCKEQALLRHDELACARAHELFAQVRPSPSHPPALRSGWVA